jgi:hypothetical protein
LRSKEKEKLIWGNAVIFGPEDKPLKGGVKGD